MAHGLDLSYDGPCCKRSGRMSIGIDEVGRGSLIGEVTAAAVRFTGEIPDGLRDSKKLTAARRQELDLEIRKVAFVSVGSASVAEIDQYGILKAALIAMARAWNGIPQAHTSLSLVDGNQRPPIQGEVELIIQGDNRCPSIAAASIVAKVYRDALITRISEELPQYGWGKNKGYGTDAHMKALEVHGVSCHHRTSFAPIRKLLRTG